MKLLIADDSPELRSLLNRLCATFAAETRECADGAEAVHVFREFLPDWTLMDLAMPRVDGLAATRQILARHPGARIIVMTQHRGLEYEQAAREAGACAFILKEDFQPLIALLSQSITPNPTAI